MHDTLTVFKDKQDTLTPHLLSTLKRLHFTSTDREGLETLSKKYLGIGIENMSRHPHTKLVEEENRKFKLKKFS